MHIRPLVMEMSHWTLVVHKWNYFLKVLEPWFWIQFQKGKNSSGRSFGSVLILCTWFILWFVAIFQNFLIALYSVCANILFPLPVNNLTYLQHGKEAWRRRRRRRREARRRTSARTRPSGRPPRPPPARPWPARHTPKREWPLLLLLDAVMLLRPAKSTFGANLAFWKVTFQFCHKR